MKLQYVSRSKKYTIEKGDKVSAIELVKMENISVEFPGVKALQNVNFNLKAGEVHVLLGENGAGKSTLIKVLSGVNKITSGKIFIEGKEVSFHNEKQARQAGVSVIYQELNLVKYLTVAENIFLGKQIKNKAGLINWKKMNNEATEIIKKLNVDIDPKAKIKDLGIAQQQMVEVAKALNEDAKIIVMDEPTSSLTDHEITQLFRIIHELKAKGIGIIYISHRLEEFNYIGDRVTVLRDGKYIGEHALKDCTTDDLIKMMVGRELKDKYPKEVIHIGREIFRVDGICTFDKLKNCSFSVGAGEILGIAGLMGAGRTELARAIIGADKRTNGSIYVKGQKVHIKNPRQAVKNGISFLTEDRKQEGLILNHDIKSNITITVLEKILSYGFLNRKKERKISNEMVEKLKIKTPCITQKVKNLSGGNQQKVVLSKWMLTGSDIVIFDEPTRGIDVGAKTEIYKQMTYLAKQGKAIIMISSEIPELLGMSDRIIVMHDGAIVGELTMGEVTQEKILAFASGGC